MQKSKTLLPWRWQASPFRPCLEIMALTMPPNYRQQIFPSVANHWVIIIALHITTGIVPLPPATRRQTITSPILILTILMTILNSVGLPRRLPTSLVVVPKQKGAIQDPRDYAYLVGLPRHPTGEKPGPIQSFYATRVVFDIRNSSVDVLIAATSQGRRTRAVAFALNATDRGPKSALGASLIDTVLLSCTIYNKF